MAEPAADSSTPAASPAGTGWPFSARLMLTISSLVVASGLVILLIAQDSAMRDARTMADRLFREVSQHAADQSRNYLQRVIPLIDSLTTIADAGSLPLNENDSLADRLLPYLKNNEGITWISYADDTGRFVGVQRVDGALGSNISYLDPAGHTHLTECAFAADGSHHVTNTNPDSGYDPRNRPYYQKAVAGAGQAVWQDPYIFYGRRVPGISCAKSITRPGGHVGVFSIDFTLETLQQHLNNLHASERSILCVYTDTGRLVATQGDRTSNATTLPTLEEADPKLAALLKQSDSSGEPFDLTWQGEKYFATSLPFEVAPGQRWIVGVIAPADDFLGGAYRTQRHALYACAGALLAAITIAAALARRVSRPVKEITAVMASIGDGNLDATADVRGAREFRQLSASLTKMVGNLREGLRLRHSIGVAMQVQQRLLPQHPPKVAGLDLAGYCKYCDETGGDYYDFLAADDRAPGRLMIVIGDVTGHGVGAALVMASARAVLRDRVHEEHSLADLLTRLNHLIGHDTDSSQFMTMQIVVIDTTKNEYKFASAGHDAAVIYRAADDRFEEIDEAGLPLGVMEDGMYENYTAPPLATGDIVLIGTDGVWEMHGPGEDLFGKDRLKTVIRENSTRPSADIAIAIEAALDEFRQGRSVADDVTFVIVKRV